jgi:hypothetical protein
MPETIYFNGKKYESISEMPPNVRQMYERINRFLTDADQDGIPDALQASNLSGLKEAFGAIKDIAQLGTTAQGMNQVQLSVIRETDRGILVNGKEFKSVEEMPSEIRQIYEDVTNSAQEGNFNIYDETWREVQRDDFFEPHDDEILNRQFARQSSTLQTPIETVDSNARLVMIIVAALIIIGGLVFAWFLFF